MPKEVCTNVEQNVTHFTERRTFDAQVCFAGKKFEEEEEAGDSCLRFGNHCVETYNLRGAVLLGNISYRFVVGL